MTESKISDIPVCLFHDAHHRGQYQRLLNTMREHIIPVKYIHRVGLIVCTCKNKDDYITAKCSAIDDEVEKYSYSKMINTIFKWLKTEVQKPQKIHTEVKNRNAQLALVLMEQIFSYNTDNSASDELSDNNDEFSASSSEKGVEHITWADKMASVKQPVKEGCTSLVEKRSEEDVMGEEENMEDEDQLVEADSTQPATISSSKRLAYIILEATRTCYDCLQPPDEQPKDEIDPKEGSLSFNLTLPGDYLGIFFGKNGRNLRTLNEKYDVKIKISYPSLGHRFYRAKRNFSYWSDMMSITEVRAKVTPNSTQCIRAAEACKSDLINLALRVVTKRNAHTKRVNLYYSNKLSAAKRPRRMPNSQRRGIPMWDAKEKATDHFVRRQMSEKKEKAVGGHGHHKSPRILQRGSRCLQCLTLLNGGTEVTSECVSHSGYPVTQKETKEAAWSCCGEKLPDTKMATLQQSHRENGCQQGHHNWRPNQKDGQKYKPGRKGEGHWSDPVNQAIRTSGCSSYTALQLAQGIDQVL